MPKCGECPPRSPQGCLLVQADPQGHTYGSVLQITAAAEFAACCPAPSYSSLVILNVVVEPAAAAQVVARRLLFIPAELHCIALHCSKAARPAPGGSSLRFSTLAKRRHDPALRGSSCALAPCSTQAHQSSSS